MYVGGTATVSLHSKYVIYKVNLLKEFKSKEADDSLRTEFLVSTWGLSLKKELNKPHRPF